MESLAYRYSFRLNNFPERWLPLIALYDSDLPLFPIYYFHVLPENFDVSSRPTADQRAYGYIEKINIFSDSSVEITIISNKDLSNTGNRAFLSPVENEVKERLGLNNPVTHNDVSNCFTGSLSYANRVLSEMWHRVISNAYGNVLPFGRLWDGTLGLTRFVSSWNSPSGRKGELIQTHYFMSKFGERIQSSSNLPQVDFYLLPTIQELTDPNNPLGIFPLYSRLVDVAHSFQTRYCSLVTFDNLSFSKFTNPHSGRFDTEHILEILNNTPISEDNRPYALECFNSFDKGPQRTVIFLMMLDDLRQRRINPSLFSSAQCGSIYENLAGTYQTPKAIQIYAQQSFGNPHAIPIDTWIETFFRWPLKVWPIGRGRDKYRHVLLNSDKLGKTERLLWIAAQARKVHSSACNDIIWCTKYGSSKQPRGANPFACNICSAAIRNCCPAYLEINTKTVTFNGADSNAVFNIETSLGNNQTPNQSFIKCSGFSIYSDIVDDFSPSDDSTGFASFPINNNCPNSMTVADFVNYY
jgi:hypothetical protein